MGWYLQKRRRDRTLAPGDQCYSVETLSLEDTLPNQALFKIPVNNISESLAAVLY